MTNKPSIVFICSRLDLAGGTEKAVINTANLFASNNHKVSLLILDETNQLFFPLHPSVEIIQANLHFGITPKGNFITRKFAFQNHIKQLRQLLKNINADFVIATEYHFSIAAHIAAKNLKCKIFAWEHHHFNELGKSSFWKFLFQRYYKKLDAVVCLNKDEAFLFERINAKTIVIPNFVEQKTVRTGSSKTILTVARLSHVKGIDYLLLTAQHVLSKSPEWKWKLIGDGEMRQEVEAFIIEKKLQGKLILQQPVSPDLEKEYSEAALYVMTSRNECFPMVLLEAMSYGVPCIAFDCDTGPRAIITNEVDGVLVNEESTLLLQEITMHLMNEEDVRKKMGEEAIRKVEQFSPEKVYRLWEQLFNAQNT